MSKERDLRKILDEIRESERKSRKKQSEYPDLKELFKKDAIPEGMFENVMQILNPYEAYQHLEILAATEGDSRTVYVRSEDGIVKAAEEGRARDRAESGVAQLKGLVRDRGFMKRWEETKPFKDLNSKNFYSVNFLHDLDPQSKQYLALIRLVAESFPKVSPVISPAFLDREIDLFAASVGLAQAAIIAKLNESGKSLSDYHVRNIRDGIFDYGRKTLANSDQQPLIKRLYDLGKRKRRIAVKER